MSGLPRELLADARAVVRQALRALRPPPRLTLSEWADRNYRLSADAGAAEPGRWSTRPYQREPMDAMTDPRVESVTLYKSARVGYTEWLKALIGYHVEHDPCPILIVQPSEDDAKGFAKESIEPLIRDCPTVGERFTTSRRDTMLLRRFVGGILQIAGARSPGNFRRVSRRVVLSDELDGYPASAGKEGDPRVLAEKRSESFWNRKHVRGSTPTDKGHSRIERLFFDGDQRRRYLPCPHCQGMQVLQLKNLDWRDRPPEEAAFVCIHCAERIEHEHLRWMDARGEWRPGPHPQFPDDPPPGSSDGRHRSYHIWSAYSYLPNATWGHIAVAFVKADQAGPTELKTFVNTWLGETWVSRGEAPEWDRLYARRETYEIGTVPKGALFLVAGVDVQPDRLIWEVIGWGRGKESWSIEIGELPGNTADLGPNGPWTAIDALLDRSYPHEAGQQLRIRMIAIDSGNQTQTVYSYGRSKKDTGRVMVVKGVPHTDVLVGSPTKQDVAPSGQRIGSVLLWNVGVSLAKSEFYGWLALRLPTEKERAAGAGVPPGYCHFPQHGEDFFKQITGEQLVSYTDSHGFTVRVWEKVPGRQNHHLDIRNYARAAAAVVGLDRSQESDWLERERILNIKKDPGDPPTSTTPPPATPAPKKPGLPTKGKQPWIGRRRGGWLKDR